MKTGVEEGIFGGWGRGGGALLRGEGVELVKANMMGWVLYEKGGKRGRDELVGGGVFFF